MPDPKQIAVVTPAGDVRTIASTDAADAAEQGFELATTEQVKGAKNQAKFDEASALGKAGYVAGAAGAGALRGLSAGLSDAVLVHGAGLLGKDSATATRETLNELRDVAPTASLLGEGAGLIGGMALGSGEVGVGGKALTAVSRAGGLAERGAARLLGAEAAEGLAARALTGAVAKGAAGAVEGSLYGAGNAISEAALGDERLTGEKLIADMGHGAIFGGALGAAFGGVGGALSRRGKAAQLAEVIAEREGVAAPEAVGGWRATLGKKASEGVKENVLKSTGATLGEIEKLDKFGSLDRAANNILKETEAFTKRDFALASKQDIADAAASALERTNEIKRSMLSELDAAKVAPPSRQTIFQSFADHVAPYISHLDEAGNPVFHAGAADDLAPALKFARQMEKAKVNTFEDLFRESRNLRQKTGFQNGSTAAKDKHLMALFDAIESEMERAADAGGTSFGQAWSQQWNATKALQQDMIFAERNATKGANAGIKNNSSPLAASIGAFTGLATGSPVGGIASAVLGRAIKEQGDQLAASAWRRIADFAGVQQAIARVDSQVNNGVQKLLGSAVPKTPMTAPSYLGDIPREAATYAAATRKEDREGYHAAATAIRSDAARPGAVAERVAEQLAPYAGVAPKATAAASATAIRGLMFLHSKLPPATNDPFSPTPQFQKPDRMTSDVEIAKFMRYKEAVDNPTRVLSLIAKGKGTRQHVEALREVYPNLYAQMQNDVNRRLMDAKRPLSYEERLKLGVFYDMPTMRAMTPEFQKNIQGTFLPTPQEPASVPSGGPKIDIAGDTMTSTDKAAYR